VSRLFITPREIDFISDVVKEITKDVIGDVIYYYKVREDVSQVHDVYEEALEKIFDPPVEVDARVQWNPKEVRTDRFGHEGIYQTEVYIHYRDMIDRGIKLEEGDYFQYGDNFFEITSIVYDKQSSGKSNIFVDSSSKRSKQERDKSSRSLTGLPRKYTQIQMPSEKSFNNNEEMRLKEILVSWWIRVRLTMLPTCNNR